MAAGLQPSGSAWITGADKAKADTAVWDLGCQLESFLITVLSFFEVGATLCLAYMLLANIRDKSRQHAARPTFAELFYAEVE